MSGVKVTKSIIHVYSYWNFVSADCAEQVGGIALAMEGVEDIYSRMVEWTLTNEMALMISNIDNATGDR